MSRPRATRRLAPVDSLDRYQSILDALRLLGVELDKGDSGRGHCPACGGGSSGRPSLSVKSSHGWRCWRGQFEGGVAGGWTGLSLLEHVLGIDRRQACSRLGYSHRIARRLSGVERRAQPRPLVSQATTEVLEAVLELCEPGAVLSGIPEPVCSYYGLRWLPSDTQGLYRRLRQEYGFSTERLCEAGLSGEGGTDILCAYKGRPELAPVVFPYLDIHGRVVHLSARPSLASCLHGALEANGRGIPKSINCGRTPIPFGLWQLYEQALESGAVPSVFICEGEPDALAVASAFGHLKDSKQAPTALALAIPGAQGWKDWFLDSIPKGVPTINALDADKGGDAGTNILNRSFERAGRPVPVRLGAGPDGEGDMPRGADVSELLLGGTERGTFWGALNGMRRRGVDWLNPETGERHHIIPSWRLTSMDRRVHGSAPNARERLNAAGSPQRCRFDLVPVVEGWVWVRADWSGFEPRLALAALRRLNLWHEPLPTGADPYTWLAQGGDRTAVKETIVGLFNGLSPRKAVGISARLDGFIWAVQRARRSLVGGRFGGGLVWGLTDNEGAVGLQAGYTEPHGAFGAIIKATASDTLRRALAQVDGQLDPRQAHLGNQLHDEIWVASAPEYRDEAQRVLVGAMEAQGARFGIELPVKVRM